MNRNAALFVVMCLVWGLTWWPVKIGAEHVPPIFLAAARFTIAGALMLAWARADAGAVPRAARARLVVTALLVTTCNYALLFWGIARAPTGLAAIVNFATIPIFSLVASRVIEGEPIGRRQVAAIALGVVGLALLFASRALGALGSGAVAADELCGLAAIVLGTLLYCTGAVWSRPIAATMPVLALAGWQTMIGGIGLAALSFALEPVTLAHWRALASWPTWPALVVSRRRGLARRLHDLRPAPARLGRLSRRALCLREPGDRGRGRRRRAVGAARCGRSGGRVADVRRCRRRAEAAHGAGLNPRRRRARVDPC